MRSRESSETTTHAVEPAITNTISDGGSRSDLLELCFPVSAPASEEIRRLAYANSICLVFLALAIIGIKTPIFVLERSKPTESSIPVIFELPPETKQPEPVPIPQSDAALVDPSSEPVSESLQVVPVLAADSSQVAFAIPVEGPVLLKPAQFAPPPPRVLPPPTLPANPAPPQPVEFSSGTKDGGFYPEPDYPRLALQRRVEGRVLLYVIVDETGTARSVEVRDSSGSTLLDKPAVEIVKRKWHWPPGKERHYLIPFRFEIPNQ